MKAFLLYIRYILQGISIFFLFCYFISLVHDLPVPIFSKCYNFVKKNNECTSNVSKIIILTIVTGQDLFFTLRYGMCPETFFSQFLICGIFGLIVTMLAGVNLNVWLDSFSLIYICFLFIISLYETCNLKNNRVKNETYPECEVLHKKPKKYYQALEIHHTMD